MYFKCIIPGSTVSWENEVVVYQPDSGDTYLFSGVEKEIICFCAERLSFCFDDLFKFASNFFDDIEINKYVDFILEELLKKNLIVKSVL